MLSVITEVTKLMYGLHVIAVLGSTAVRLFRGLSHLSHPHHKRNKGNKR